ncbi:serine/threonine protein kinase [Minicystis rosea]|nr:serine/threonine protein kinase [Minicystis rosea]
MRLESLAEVARGGMGSVELARVLDGRLAGEIVAIKRLHANISEDQDFVSMFLDEAWITAALNHPNVARVMAWGNDEQGPFLAIELVQGVSLSRLLKEAQTNQEPFAERTVAFICSQICAGLTAAHSLAAPDGTPLGIVHRDLTPANVLVSFDGDVKIIDFGIAKAEERITHTRTGQLKGKPSYMAPEQQRAGFVDHRADLFAFGVTMFELLAGRRPWAAKGAFDVMMEIANDPHPDLGELRRGLNPEFVAIAHKCLEKKADARFQSAAEIKTRLDAWLAAKGFAADDRQSLAQFVQRNSLPQVKWWEEALRGEHAKKKTQTFKELEEGIDRAREQAEKAARRAAPPPPRPAAGSPTMSGGATAPASGNRPPPVPPKKTIPMAAAPHAGPPPSGTPASDRSVPSSGPVSSGQGIPSSGQGALQVPPSSGQGALQSAVVPQPAYGPQAAPMSQRFAPSGAPPSSTPSSAPSPQLAGAGTEFMAISPFASGAAPQGPPSGQPWSGASTVMMDPGLSFGPSSPHPASAPHAGSSPLAGTMLMEPGTAFGPSGPVTPHPASAPHAMSTPHPASAPRPPAASHASGALAPAGALQTLPSGGMSPASAMQAASGPQAAIPSPSANASQALLPSAPAPTKSRGWLVLPIAFLLVGGALAGWIFRDRLLNPSGASATDRAQPATPAGKAR